MKYPKEWKLDHSGDMGTEFILFNPSSSSDSFKENINLLIQPLGEKIRTLDEFVEVSEMQVATNLFDDEIHYSSRGKLNGMVCHSMAYEGQVGLNSLRFEQFYISVGDAIYILTMTCLVDNYDRFYAVTNEIMASFKVKY